MGCGSELVKFVLILFNFLCMICSVCIIVYGYPIAKQLHDFSSMKEHLVIDIVAVVPLVLGGLLFLMALLGCCGALRGNPCQLRTFSVIMLCLFIGTLTLVIFVWTDYDKMVRYVNVFMQETWHNHKTHEPADKILHRLERSLKCCGVSGFMNYSFENEAIPPSCCGLQTGNCSVSMVYKNGCLNVLKHMLESHTKVIKIGALAASGVTLLASTFASYLAHQMSRSFDYGYD